VGDHRTVARHLSPPPIQTVIPSDQRESRDPQLLFVSCSTEMSQCPSRRQYTRNCQNRIHDRHGRYSPCTPVKHLPWRRLRVSCISRVQRPSHSCELRRLCIFFVSFRGGCRIANWSMGLLGPTPSASGCLKERAWAGLSCKSFGAPRLELETWCTKLNRFELKTSD